MRDFHCFVAIENGRKDVKIINMAWTIAVDFCVWHTATQWSITVNSDVSLIAKTSQQLAVSLDTSLLLQIFLELLDARLCCGIRICLGSRLRFIVTEKHVIVSVDLYKEDAYLSSTRMRTTNEAFDSFFAKSFLQKCVLEAFAFQLLRIIRLMEKLLKGTLKEPPWN